MRITQPNQIVLPRLAALLLIAIVIGGVELRGQSGRRGSKPAPMPTPQPAQPTPPDDGKPSVKLQLLIGTNHTKKETAD